jgi:hypothetical protein
MANPASTVAITCSTTAAPDAVTGRPYPDETPQLVATSGRHPPSQTSFNMKVYDDQGNLRLSAVRNGPAAGLGEMGPRESTFANVDPAAIGDMGPQGRQVPHLLPAVPDPIATMDEDRVPLRDQGTSLRARGQYSPYNTTNPHSQAENFAFHDGTSGCSFDDEEDSEPDGELEGEEEDDYADRESEPEYHEDETSPPRDVGHYDQDDRDTIRPPSNLAHRAMSNGGLVSENLHPGGVKRRRSSFSHLASDVPANTPSQDASQQERLDERWLALDQCYATTSEASPLGDLERRTKRSNQVHLQVAHQPNGGALGQPSVLGGAVGTHSSTLGPCSPSGPYHRTVDPFHAHRNLHVSNGLVRTLNSTLSSCPPLVNISNSTTSRTPPNFMGGGDVSPGTRPPRYAPNDVQASNRLREQIIGDNRPGMSIFPPGLSRAQIGANPGLNIEDHDRSGDKSRSLRGQRRSGQAHHDDGSPNLTNDLNDMWESSGVVISDFRSPMSSPDRVVVGGVRGVAERNLSSEEHRQDHDNSRSMRGQLPTGPRWFETSPRELISDLSFSPQNTRTSIVHASQDLGIGPWIDSTDRQMVTRVSQSQSLHYNGPRDIISQHVIQYGDDRGQRSNIVLHIGTGSLVPSSILPLCRPMPAPPQHSNYTIYDAGPTRHSITMGLPVSLGPGLERYNVTMVGATDLTPGPVRSSRPRNPDQVPVRNRVAAIEQGASSRAYTGSPRGFNATELHGGKDNTKGKRRTNSPQTYQAFGANMGKGRGATTDAVALMGDTPVGYTTLQQYEAKGQRRQRSLAES